MRPRKGQIEAGIAALPNYQEHEDKDGYSFTTLNGQRVHVRGATVADEVFQTEDMALNISKALVGIAGEASMPTTRLPIDAKLKDHIKARSIDKAHANHLSKSQRNTPILSVLMEGGLMIIDGHHRLARLIADGATYVQSYVLRPETISYMQVDWYVEGENGELVPINDELAERMLPKTGNALSLR
jgi:hypothetical protein